MLLPQKAILSKVGIGEKGAETDSLKYTPPDSVHGADIYLFWCVCVWEITISQQQKSEG